MQFGDALDLNADASGWWTGDLQLPRWRDWIDSENAEVYVELNCPGAGPSTAQAAAIKWLIANEAAAEASVTAALLAAYPTLRDRYKPGAKGGLPAALMPPVAEVGELRGQIELNTLYFHDLPSPDGQPYIGYSFYCRWDEEHGLGVMMCGLRCVDVGGADTALLDYIAKRDARGEAPKPKRAAKKTAPAKAKRAAKKIAPAKAKRVAKKTAPAKAKRVAKKTAAKRTARVKAKAVAKKPTAKKTAAKKTAAKKTAAKKTAAKKTAAKKTAAKKTAAKKTAKKTAAKKPARAKSKRAR